jgi:ketosteroid isomerase-like protein
MSEENVELFRQAVDAFNRRDRDAWLALSEPQFENTPPREWPESAPMRGREVIWDFFVSNMEPWEESAFEFGELIDAGDKVVAEQRAMVRGKSSGAPCFGATGTCSPCVTARRRARSGSRSGRRRSPQQD